jgi:TonB family protein
MKPLPHKTSRHPAPLAVALAVLVALVPAPVRADDAAVPSGALAEDRAPARVVEVVLALDIDESGNVSDIDLVRSSGSIVLDELANRRARERRFEVRLDEHGEPRPYRLREYTVTLDLRGSAQRLEDEDVPPAIRERLRGEKPPP